VPCFLPDVDNVRNNFSPVDAGNGSVVHKLVKVLSRGREFFLSNQGPGAAGRDNRASKGHGMLVMACESQTESVSVLQRVNRRVRLTKQKSSLASNSRAGEALRFDGWVFQGLQGYGLTRPEMRFAPAPTSISSNYGV
jgi:hypothetical protein